MMTVPVASRPRLPALPAIWMYSPESTGWKDERGRQNKASPTAARPREVKRHGCFVFFLLQMKEWQEHRTWEQVSETGPVVFPDVVEHHGPGRHVHAHRECLSGKEHLNNRKKRR